MLKVHIFFFNYTMAFFRKNKPAPKPETANEFRAEALQNFGNTKMDEAISSIITNARASNDPKAIALADAYETGALASVDCDHLFKIAGGLPEGENRDAIAVQMSQIRKTMRWNAGFGARMSEFKPKDAQSRLAYGDALVQNLVANGAIPSRITANNLAAQAPDLKIAKAVLNKFTASGVIQDVSSQTVLLSKAIADGNHTAATKLMNGLKTEALDARTAKIVERQEAQMAAMGGSTAKAAE